MYREPVVSFVSSRLFTLGHVFVKPVRGTPPRESENQYSFATALLVTTGVPLLYQFLQKCDHLK